MIKQTLITISLFLSISLSNAKESEKYVAIGKSSWYSVKCNGGTKTASGQKLNNNSNTAAHKTLPFGTLVRVTNLKNGKSEVVKINNRGPYIKGRIIDVTIGVAKKLDFVNSGIVEVKIEVVD